MFPKLLTILFVLGLPIVSPGVDQPAGKPQVYLLIGQSNMAGRAGMDGDTAPIPRCLLLNDKDEWEPASNPLNRHSTIRKGLGMQKLGPGAGFARGMLKRDPGLTLGLVVNAKGGSRIDEWKKGGRFYNEAVRRAKEAAKSGELAGILWHQGESDNGKPEGYLDKLAALVANLREDLGAPDLPFVAGQVNKAPAINEQIARLPETVKGTAFASSDGLVATDRWHFDTASANLLGERYAEAMAKLQQARR